MDRLSKLYENLPVIGIAAGSILFVRIVWFGCDVARRRYRMVDYNRFVRQQYTERGDTTPTLILRIQNSYIEEYNELGRQWLGRYLFQMRIYPAKDEMGQEINENGYYEGSSTN